MNAETAIKILFMLWIPHVMRPTPADLISLNKFHCFANVALPVFVHPACCKIGQAIHGYGKFHYKGWALAMPMPVVWESAIAPMPMEVIAANTVFWVRFIIESQCRRG